jgi:hypothetical protein
MIQCIFTLDYEIYGNGEGSLRELVYEPAQRIAELFRKWEAPLVTFVEVAELEMMEAYATDKDIELVKGQVREFYRERFELGLHLHPQWYNARYENNRWLLDNSEYNLCTLPRERIIQIIDRSLSYFRKLVSASDFTPFSFRAGNWLFQPSHVASQVLVDRGIKIDSSVFKGGLQRNHNLDYRRALKNGFFWTFSDSVDIPDPRGVMLELPIYTRMVPFWKMLTHKRVGLQRKGTETHQNQNNKTGRLSDYSRLRYPLKLDFCRMTEVELASMMDNLIKQDLADAVSFKPIVAIGHTKDLTDLGTTEFFLSYLKQHEIHVSTLQQAYPRCSPHV